MCTFFESHLFIFILLGFLGLWSYPQSFGLRGIAKWFIVLSKWSEVDSSVDNFYDDMMIGEYRHNIDAKKRIAVPAKFRKEIGEKAIIAKGQEKCLFVYPVDEWEKVAEKLSQLPTGSADNRNFVRIFLSGAVDVEIDALGRILVPDYLKEFAGLKEKVVITGLYKKLEIWDEGHWNDYKARMESQTDSLAEKLGELGVY